ncbi:hypothetical protein [Streptomyces sp. NPDC055506]
MGDAAVEFYSGDRLLGRPVPGKDGHTFRLDLEGVTLGAPKDLQVRAAGRRLDEAGVKAEAKRRSAKKQMKPVEPSALPPANPVDPGVPGPYRTVSGEYTLKSVKLPDFPVPVEMRATVTAPAGAQGMRPLALFLHGRHATCFAGGADGEALGAWPCPTGSKPIPSHRGYLHDQKLLASQGYVTVSISANGINGQDYAAQDAGAQARSSLVRQHLARWADWSGAGRTKAPEIVRKAARADLSRVLLVGHSRGGEGVNRAAMDSLAKPPADKDGYRGPARWKIRGTVLIGPTVFGQNPAPDVPSMTILPGCDGDVSDLQGEIYVDGTRGVSRGAALHSAVYMVGANHNYFNTEWTPGQAEAPANDDFWHDEETPPDPVCTPGTATRLTAERQQAAGSTYIAAAARLFVAGDDRVRPLLDGSGVRAASAGPARVLTHAVGARRTAAFLPDAPVTVDGGRLCAQVDTDPATACLDPESPGRSPHFAEWETEREPGRDAVAFDWSAPGSAVQVRPGRPVSLSGAEALALRVIVPPNTTGTRMDVSLTDSAGRQAKLGAVRLDGLPGSDRTASYWGQEVRVPLTAATAAGLDLKRVKSLVLTPRSGSGRAWLMDAWGWRPGMAAVRPVALPRVDIGVLTADEGDSGVRTLKVPVRLSGQGSGQVRLFVADPGNGEVTSRLVTVRAGSSVDVPVEVRGNTRFSYGSTHNVFAKAVRGAVIGNHLGGLTVRDDDPMPTFKATPLAGRVTEGQSMKWRIEQSAVADTDLWLGAAFAKVDGGAELSSTDVDPQWFEQNTGESPSPARPLSEVEVFYPDITVPAGGLSTELSVPTVVDGVSEPEEALRMRLSIWEDERGEVEGPMLDGTVVDAP